MAGRHKAGCANQHHLSATCQAPSSTRCAAHPTPFRPPPCFGTRTSSHAPSPAALTKPYKYQAVQLTTPMYLPCTGTSTARTCEHVRTGRRGIGARPRSSKRPQQQRLVRDLRSHRLGSRSPPPPVLHQMSRSGSDHVHVRRWHVRDLRGAGTPRAAPDCD